MFFFNNQFLKLLTKQVTPAPEAMKISTKEYMDREKAKNGEVMIKGKDVLNNVSRKNSATIKYLL